MFLESKITDGKNEIAHGKWENLENKRKNKKKRKRKQPLPLLLYCAISNIFTFFTVITFRGKIFEEKHLLPFRAASFWKRSQSYTYASGKYVNIKICLSLSHDICGTHWSPVYINITISKMILYLEYDFLSRLFKILLSRHVSLCKKPLFCHSLSLPIWFYQPYSFKTPKMTYLKTYFQANFWYVPVRYFLKSSNWWVLNYRSPRIFFKSVVDSAKEISSYFFTNSIFISRILKVVTGINF